MTGLTTITWKSLTVLPALVGVSVCVALVIALRQGLSLHSGLGLVVSALALSELGYLCLLLVLSRRAVDGSDPVASERRASKR
jgi:hypothetical protein